MRNTLLVSLLAGLPLVAFACDPSRGVTPSDDDPGNGDASTPKKDGATADDDNVADDAASSTDSAPPCGTDGGPGCGEGHPCTQNSECEALCTNGMCTAPTTSDGRISPSLGETDIDCGGTKAPRCSDAKGCSVAEDCVSNACSAITKKCVVARSCIGAGGASGIETCGTDEPGKGTNESCCQTLPLPTRTSRRLDRYEITGGRIRAFVEAMKAMNGGQANIRAFAKAYAAANPKSELGVVATSYPGLLDVLPDQNDVTAKVPLAWHLGLSPIDPINTLDGCDTSPGSYGHVTYWQDATTAGAFGLPARAYDQAALDAKPMNCVMPLVLATFCAWDGGELARTQDYQEVWGKKSFNVSGTTIFLPWASALNMGQFNYRNGHGTSCAAPAVNFSGCVNPQPSFYLFPLMDRNGANINLADDQTPQIAAPGRFPLDVTAITSANGNGWYDIAGNLLEAAWPVGTVVPGGAQTTDVCDVSAVAGAGDTACSRLGRSGVRRYAGQLPHIALIGYSFEGHARRSENYLSGTDAENKITAGDLKPVTFQYGKVGGRCAR